MGSKAVETAIPFWADRSIDPRLAGPFAQQLEASGVVDYFWVWDQLTSWWPHVLWTPENTPVAEVIRDVDSFHDAFVVCGIAAAATTKLGIKIGGTDAIRARPAELLQTMATLAGATDGKAICTVAAGELKQIKPFGYKRSEGLTRMEDIFRLANLLWECDGPIDFDGNHWKYRQAYIGKSRPHRPQFWSLGGGPKLIEISSRYADGFMSGTPAVFYSPEQYAAEVKHIKEQVERAGRDPDAFRFGLQSALFLHEDRDAIERSFDNPLLKWFGCIAGRFHQPDWEREGLKSVWPEGWHYALRMLPAQMTREEVEAIVAKVPREMVAKSAHYGSPKEVAAMLQEYVDAGADFIGVCDLLPSVMPLEEAPKSIERAIEVCRILKSG